MKFLRNTIQGPYKAVSTVSRQMVNLLVLINVDKPAAQQTAIPTAPRLVFCKTKQKEKQKQQYAQQVMTLIHRLHM